MRDRIKVVNNQDMGKAEATMSISMKDGPVHMVRTDMDIPETDLDRQWSRLSKKFLDMAGPVIGDVKAARVVELIADLENAGDLNAITALCKG